MCCMIPCYGFQMARPDEMAGGEGRGAGLGGEGGEG